MHVRHVCASCMQPCPIQRTMTLPAEYCERGSLYDVLRQARQGALELPWHRRLSLVRPLAWWRPAAAAVVVVAVAATTLLQLGCDCESIMR